MGDPAALSDFGEGGEEVPRQGNPEAATVAVLGTLQECLAKLDELGESLAAAHLQQVIEILSESRAKPSDRG